MDAVIFLMGGLVPAVMGAVVLGTLAAAGGRAGSTLAIRGWTWNAAGLAVYGLTMLALTFGCFWVWALPMLLLGEPGGYPFMWLSTIAAVAVWASGALVTFRKMFLVS